MHMANHLFNGDITSSPEGFIPLGELTIPTSYNELVIPGISLQPDPREKELPENGLLFIGMNSAAYTKVPFGKAAQVYTLGLAGCTGVAGTAQIEGGTLAGISHFDAMVDADNRENGIGPSERYMNRFIRIARACGAEAIQLAVKYAALHHFDEHYGEYGDNYADWHFVDQLVSFAEEAEEDVNVTIEPYEDPIMSHTLAVNVEQSAKSHIAFL
jgi:hypothetical protein